MIRDFKERSRGLVVEKVLVGWGLGWWGEEEEEEKGTCSTDNTAEGLGSVCGGTLRSTGTKEAEFCSGRSVRSYCKQDLLVSCACARQGNTGCRDQGVD